MRKRLIYFLLAVFFAKLLVWAYVAGTGPERFAQPDTPSYLSVARDMLSGAYFADFLKPQAVSLRTPGYPAFLAVVFLPIGESLIAVAFCQILLSLGTLLAVHALATRVWPECDPLWAVALLALCMPTFSVTFLGLSETLYVFVLSAMLWMLAAHVDEPRPSQAFYLGILFVAATFIRPIGYYLCPLLLLAVILPAIWTKQGWRRSALCGMAFALPFVLLAGGYQYRNYHVSGSAEFSAIQTHNLVDYRAAGVIALKKNISLREARREVSALIEQRTGEDMTGKSLARETALEILINNPWPLLEMSGRAAVRMLFGPGAAHFVALFSDGDTPSGDAGPLWRPAATAYGVMYLLVLYFGILSWVIATLRGRQRPGLIHYIFWAIAGYFVLVSAGPESYSRFRVPIMPILVLYSGAGLQLFIKQRRNAR